MPDAMLAQLREVSLFQAVEEDGLGHLARRAQRRRLGAGKLVFEAGEPADSLYVVLGGSVKIFIHDAAGREVVLDTKRRGQYFGEMMLDYRPRSASIVTLEPCEFAVIGRDDFRAFLAAHPRAAEQLILNLIHATRGMNERVQGYMKWLGEAKALDLPAFKRWIIAKRWVLFGLLAVALAQFYFMDVLVQILSLPGVSVFTGR